MIYLLYGPDTYRSRRLLSDIVDEFKKKAGRNTPALFWFDAEEDDAESIMRLRGAQSLFAVKQLIVIEHLFSSKKNTLGQTASTASIESFLARCRDMKDSTFVLWEGDCEKSAAFEAAKRYAGKVQEFRPLAGVKLERWTDDELARRTLDIPRTEKARLVHQCGGDLWKLSNALDKYEAGGFFSNEKVLEEPKIWNFTDTFLENKRRALAVAVRILSNGTDTLYLLAALTKTMRIMLALHDAAGKKISVAEVGKKMKLHPYVAKKQAAAAEKLSRSAILQTYRLLGGADVHTKTGKLPASLAFLNLFVKN